MIQEINFVNLVGQMTSNPKIVRLENGKRVVKFSLSTSEPYLDENGKTCFTKNWHRLTAWGKWIPILEELCEKGQGLAIEGRLRSKHYSNNGEPQSYTEIEVNDLIIL